MMFRRAAVAALTAVLLPGAFAPAEAGRRGKDRAPRAAPVLEPDDVRRAARFAAQALDTEAMVIAVVDRNGSILGLFRKAAAPAEAPGNFPEGLGRDFDPGTDPPFLADADAVAVALARTGAFFSNDQAPLSSRTVRFISGIHFPPGISNAPNAALYGIENTNRGCSFNTAPDIFPVPRALRPGGAVCDPFDTSGCGRGILTGKANLLDDDPGSLHPGGMPLYKIEVSPGGRSRLRVVGGIGVVVYPKPPGEPLPRDERLAFGLQAEWAAGRGMRALLSADPDRDVLSCKELFDALERLIPPAVIFLDGIRLPFIEQCGQPAGTSKVALDPAIFLDDSNWAIPPAGGASVPDGYLLGPAAGGFLPESLSQAEVGKIVKRVRKQARRTRAGIRLPIGSSARFVIAVADRDGRLLAVFRQSDATVFSIDVAVAKARNVTFFSGPGRLERDMPGVPIGTAVTNRTIGFGAQPLFPPGIDAVFPGSPPGPWFDDDGSRAGFLYAFDTANPCTQGSQPPDANQSGIVFFPGSAPLYRRLPGPDGKRGNRDDEFVLIGGLGVSGDGVEQDDLATFAGTKGFRPPRRLRADSLSVGGVRLPYLKFNRNPERTK